MAALALLLTASACGSDSSKAGSGEKTSVVKIALPAMSAYSWDVYVAKDLGFFAKNGLEPQITTMQGPAPVVAALVSGSVDIGIAFSSAILPAKIKGADIKYIAGCQNKVSGTLLGSKSVKDVAAIKGKTLLVSSLADPLTQELFKQLGEEGLPKGSYDVSLVGDSTGRYAALQAGGVAAAVLTSPLDLEASKAGYPALIKLLADGFTSGHAASARFRSNKAAALGYARSIVQADAWMLDPANKEKAIEVLIKETKVARDAAEAAYDLFIGQRLFQKGAPLPEDLLLAQIKGLEAQGLVENPSMDPNEYVDYALLKKAQEPS